MNYQQAERIGNSSLKTLIVRNLSDQNTIGSSVKSAVRDKLTASYTRIKRKFDPLNIVRMMTGELSAAMLGHALGRSADDVKYFGGQRGNSIVRHIVYNRHDRLNEAKEKSNDPKKDPLHTSMSSGQHQKLRKGDGLADVLTKTYVLINQIHEEYVKNFELDQLHRKERESERDKWNKDLVDAIEKRLGSQKSLIEKPQSEGIVGLLGGLFKGIWSKLKLLFEGLLTTALKGVWNVVKLIGEGIWKLATSVGKYIVPILTKIGGWAIKLLGWLGKNLGPVIGPLAIGSLPLLAMGAVTYAVAPDETGANTKTQNKVLKKVLDTSGFKAQTTSTVPKEDLEKDGFFGPSTAKKARAANLARNIKDHTSTYTSSEAADIKKAYNLVVPKEMIQDKLKPVAPVPKEMIQDKLKPVAPVTPKTNIDLKDNLYDQSQKAYLTPAPKETDLGKRLQESTKNLNDSEDTIVKPVVIDNSKVIGTGSKDSGPGVAFDNTVDVRTDDPTLRKVLKQSTRWA